MTDHRPRIQVRSWRYAELALLCLYWPVDTRSDEELNSLGPGVAIALEILPDRKPGDPFMGYYFKGLTRQGKNPPGGRYGYVINDNMMAGFALVAYPADYGSTGIMTFVVSHQITEEMIW